MQSEVSNSQCAVDTSGLNLCVHEQLWVRSQRGHRPTLWDQKVSVAFGTGSLMAVMMSLLPRLSSVSASSISSKDNHLRPQAGVITEVMQTVTTTAMTMSMEGNKEMYLVAYSEACVHTSSKHVMVSMMTSITVGKRTIIAVIATMTMGVVWSAQTAH